MAGKHEYNPKSAPQAALAPVTKADLEPRRRAGGAAAAAATVKAEAAATVNPKRSVVWTVVFWVALAAFLVAAFFVVRILWAYHQGKVLYEGIAEDVLIVPSEEEAVTLDVLDVDWDALKAINLDTVGWLYMPGTVVNYPLVWSGEDSIYLRRGFDGSYSGAVEWGTIFLEGTAKPDLSCANNIFFGHAMKNGTMFAAFYRMSWNGTFNDLRDLYLLTPQGNLHLKTFAYVHVPATAVEILQTTFESEEERTAFVQDKIDKSLFAPDTPIPSAEEMTHIFSFSTCDSASGAGRYVLYAYVYDSTVSYIPPAQPLDPNEDHSVDIDLTGELALPI